MKKSFRGKLANDTQERIRLHTNNGLTGYQIIKFEVMGVNENLAYENTVKLFKNEQESPLLENVDFRDPNLLAAALYGDSSDSKTFATKTIIFDNQVFNQDIYITYIGQAGFQNDINYYIELEQVKLSKEEAATATLMDMRAGPDTRFGP